MRLATFVPETAHLATRGGMSFDMSASATPAKRILALLAGAALLVAMLAYVGPAHVVNAVKQASPVWLVLSLLAYAIFFVLRGWRWQVLLSRSAPGVRLSSATSISAVGW